MEAHERREIARAVGLARQALELDPSYAEAREYLGTTLVTRLRRFDEGLAEMERALEDAPDSASLLYALGWCYEFVAHARGREPSGAGEASALYRKAANYLRRCLALAPEGKLREDAEDLLEVIEHK